jgi:antirestriction protein
MTTATITETPRIYVASLADYNAGRLVGTWIDLTEDTTADDVHDAIADMLRQSPEPIAEEWAIHDYENFHRLTIGEYETIDHVIYLADLINQHGEAVALYLNHTGSADDFDDAYQGTWESEEAFAEHLLEESGQLAELPEWIRPYIDIEAFARDLFIDGYFSIQHDGQLYIFAHC